MRLFLTTIFILNSLIGFCQVDLFFPLKNEFNWQSVEKQNDELKKKFIKINPTKHKVYYIPPAEELEPNLHIMDFNGDGLDDIIYHGEIGEGKTIIIFINTGKSFVNIFFGSQDIYKMVFQNGKVHQLYIKNGGCCCDYIERNKIYSVDYRSKLPKINLTSQTLYVIAVYMNDWGGYPDLYVEYPSKYFDKPIKFEVVNDKCDIRFSPMINDTTKVWNCVKKLRNGNSLGEIKIGSIGYALAEEVDSTGRVWWFVAISPNAEIYNSMYYTEKTKPNTYKMGWISSRFVKIIEE